MLELAPRGALAGPVARPARRAGIGAVAIAVPETVRSNASIAARLGVSEDWIVARTGVRERRVAADGEGVVELAAAAGRRSVSRAGLDPLEVDLVLVATMSHDQLSPAAAPVVAARIGAANAGALDLDAACSGFVSALALAAGQVESGRAGRVLVVGADVMSPLIDPLDRGTAALFADGAGAVVVAEAVAGQGIGPVVLGADGDRGALVTASRAEAVIRMNGHDTFRQAVGRLSDATRAAAESARIGLGEVEAFVYHQANSRILDAVGERLGLDPARVVNCIDRYGNTSSATVPIALADAEDRDLLTAGAPVLIAAFGGGLTWAATVARWGL